jgi:hypothetical protein
MLLIELYSTETTICRLLEVAERKRKTKLPFVYMYRVYVNYDNNWRLGGRRGRDRMLIDLYNYLCNTCLSPIML